MNNSVRLIGYVGADPEVKTLDKGVSVARLRVATNERYKLKNGTWQNETTWHQIVLWDKLADRAEQQLYKGSFVMIEGKLTSRSYVNSAGQAQYITEIRATGFMLLDKKGNMHDAEEHPENTVEESLPF